MSVHFSFLDQYSLVAHDSLLYQPSLGSTELLFRAAWSVTNEQPIHARWMLVRGAAALRRFHGVRQVLPVLPFLSNENVDRLWLLTEHCQLVYLLVELEPFENNEMSVLMMLGKSWA